MTVQEKAQELVNYIGTEAGIYAADEVIMVLADWKGTELAIQDWEKIKEVISDLEPSKAIISKVLTKYLNYVFADIDWQYENLTAVEKLTVSKEEFALLKDAYELK